MNVAANLIKENQFLKEEISEVKAALKSQATQLSQKNNYIRQLEETLNKMLHAKFGASSEKSDKQLGLFNEAEELVDTEEAEVSSTNVKSHQRKSKPRVAIPDHYPREQIIHDLPDSEKFCPKDGTPLREMGEETSEQVELIPVQVKAIQHIRKKYSCPCCKEYVVTAKKPKQPIEKSIATPSLLAYVATSKYCDAMPLYRQSEYFKRLGINLDRTNLANWMIKCGQLVQPIINLMQERIFERSLIHMDETPLQVIREAGRRAQTKSYMWVMAAFDNEPICLFHYSPFRSGQIAIELLGDFRGTLMVDGYKAYDAVCVLNLLIRLGCWAHARRKFIEAQRGQAKGKTGKPDQALAYIQKLYVIEKQIKDKPNDERHRIRQEESKPILQKLRKWLDKAILTASSQNDTGKAIIYLNNQWDRLIRYIEDPSYPIDNNLGENKIRPFAVGRKNWLFCTSQSGAKASANLYSMIETAKANGLNPYEYLKQIFTELPNATTVEDIEKLLPWNIN